MPTTINSSNQTITQYAVQTGAANNLLNSIAPGTSGQALVSNGAGSQCTFQTLPVSGGGTGGSTTVPYSVVCGGTTSTGPFQQVSGVGTSGQVLTSNGAGLLPTWQASGGGGGGIAQFTGGPFVLNPNSNLSVFDFTGYTLAIGYLTVWTKNAYFAGANGQALFAVYFGTSPSLASTNIVSSLSYLTVSFVGNVLRLNSGANGQFSNLYWILTLNQHTP